MLHVPEMLFSERIVTSRPERSGAINAESLFHHGLLGLYHLDALNADETDPNFGGELRFGFGDDDPITIWRAEFGDIAGGTFDFLAGVPEPSTLMLLVLGAGALLRGGRKYGARSACCSRHR